MGLCRFANATDYDADRHIATFDRDLRQREMLEQLSDKVCVVRGECDLVAHAKSHHCIVIVSQV